MKLQLLTVFSLLQLSAGDPRLVCEETVETRMGHDVVLRCHLEPKQNIKDDEVECRRSDLDDLVYACRNGEQLANRMDHYKHRTSVSIEDLKIGVLNLTINSVTQSDNGTFNIYIHTWGIMSKVNLIVGDPPPSRDPPSGVPLGVIIGVSVVVVALVVVLILVKLKVIESR